MHFQRIKLCTKKLTHLSVFMATSILLHIVVVVIVRSKTLFVVFLDPYFVCCHTGLNLQCYIRGKLNEHIKIKG